MSHRDRQKAWSCGVKFALVRLRAAGFSLMTPRRRNCENVQAASGPEHIDLGRSAYMIIANALAGEVEGLD